MSNDKVAATYYPRSMDELPIDPDCQTGKHKACLGETYDELLDKWVECGCPCHSEAH